MTDFEKAWELAASYYRDHDEMEITKVYDAEGLWIFFAQKGDMVLYASTGISVSKDTGEIKDFFLPSDENFEILDHAKRVDLNSLQNA